MRAILLAAAVTVLGGGAAHAAGDVMAGYYGNTVTGAGDGIAMRAHYRADHSFDGTTTIKGEMRSFKGTWSLDGKGNLCRLYADAKASGGPACAPIAARTIGATWTIANGPYLLHMTLVAGIH